MATKTLAIDIREAQEDAAGKGRYCLELTKALIATAPPNVHFVLLTKAPNPLFTQQENVEQVVIPGRGFFWHLNLRAYLKAHPADLFLATTSLIYPAIAPKGQVVGVVIHDLIAKLFPRQHAFFPTLVEHLTLLSALKKSDWIFTVSQHTWKDLLHFYPSMASKAHGIIYPGVSPEFQHSDRKTLELPERFVLAVGTLQPRKNLQTLFAALESSDLHCCIVGGKGWKTKQIEKTIPASVRPRLHFLGYLRERDLIEVYSRAECLAFPSIYEGFGIPPLEAMACGCPVLASNVASLPEVVGEAAMLLPPTEVKAWAQGLEDICKPENQQKYRNLGYEQAKQFSWDISALKFWSLFE